MRIYLRVEEFEKLRLKLGYTKVALVKHLGIGRSTLEDWYKGKIVGPKNANHAANVLGVKFDEIFEIREKKSNKEVL